MAVIYTRNKGQDNEVNEKYDASSDPYKLYVEKLAADQIQLCGMKGTEFTVDMIWAGKCPIQVRDHRVSGKIYKIVTVLKKFFLNFA